MAMDTDRLSQVLSGVIPVDPGRTMGRIKPPRGVGGGLVTANFTCDATEQFRAAGIPFGRTHDIEYPFGSGEFADIHCVFPWFDADPDAVFRVEAAGAPVGKMPARRVDDDHDFEEEAVPDGELRMRGNSFALVRIPRA